MLFLHRTSFDREFREFFLKKVLYVIRTLVCSSLSFVTIVYHRFSGNAIGKITEDSGGFLCGKEKNVIFSGTYLQRKGKYGIIKMLRACSRTTDPLFRYPISWTAFPKAVRLTTAGVIPCGAPRIRRRMPNARTSSSISR